ncbi:MAG: SusD/RagB family nutrient-binding outer membrane lipoprotein [Sphingobacteriaceae bacterium]|nr:MAG: SusD/RagB family nutrient-binding outer membrane lipoprotein [Sphingobacteriaceae bacterium]
MKKIFINTSLLLLIVVTLGSCKKSLVELYNNPELTGVTTTSLPNLFTAMLNNDRVRPAYWNQRTYLMPHAAVYSQTASYSTGDNRIYVQNDNYTGNYWSDFYYPAGNGSGPMGVYRLMESTYNSLPAAEQANQQVFMQAAKIILYDQASRMIDAWGDIPFSAAGSLETASTIKDASFDDAKTLYTTLISGLNDAATFFGSATLSTNVSASFNRQDILLSGNLNKWRRYANSIRLRMLMRSSFVDEATARTVVTTMLNNSTTYPLVDGNNVGTYDPASVDILLQPLTTNINTPQSALTEISSYFAPDYMLNTVMLPANDPRIPVLFDKFGVTSGSRFTPNPTFRAMPVTFTGQEQNDNFTKFSIIDSTTFLNNAKMPGISMTAPEVNFLKAEAYERWGSSTSAQTAYNTAVAQSVSFYYYLNSIGQGKKETSPSATTITTFLAAPTVAYTGSSTDKLAKIWTQKWLNFGLLQSDQAWSEYRRTKYPQLTIVRQTFNGYETPPNRLLYPSVETGYNTNYGSVQGKDTRTTKIFWDVK